MKIEFKKELDNRCNPDKFYYYTTKDGYYVSCSLSYDEEEAHKHYERIIEETRNPKAPAIETLETTEI